MLEEAPSAGKTPEEVQDQVARITSKLAERVEQSSKTPAETYDRTGASSLVRQEADSTTTSVAAGDIYKDRLSGATVKENASQSQVELTSMQPDGSAAVLKLETGNAPQLEQFTPGGNSETLATPSVPEIVSVAAPILEDIRSKTEPVQANNNVYQLPTPTPSGEQKAA